MKWVPELPCYSPSQIVHVIDGVMQLQLPGYVLQLVRETVEVSVPVGHKFF